jgi:broad specificity phosphatase PhoE
MTTFYICRHGETENNKAERFSGWIDTPLTEAGIKNAESSAKKLEDIDLDRIISSDLGRAFITAYIISREKRYGSEVDRLTDLREINYGDFVNKLYSEYTDINPEENAEFVYPNGESLKQMQDRVLACLKGISSKYDSQSVLIVAHDGTINAIRASFTNEDIGAADTIHNAHDFVAKFNYENGEVTSFDEVTKSK